MTTRYLPSDKKTHSLSQENALEQTGIGTQGCNCSTQRREAKDQEFKSLTTKQL